MGADANEKAASASLVYYAMNLDAKSGSVLPLQLHSTKLNTELWLIELLLYQNAHHSFIVLKYELTIGPLCCCRKPS